MSDPAPGGVGHYPLEQLGHLQEEQEHMMDKNKYGSPEGTAGGGAREGGGGGGAEVAGAGGGVEAGWGNKMEFFMASLSSTIGLGNLWRFPYIAYKNGGGAFLLPYILMLVFVGFPLVAMELAVGQYSHQGAVGVWKLCPIAKGIGWTMVALNMVCNTCYTTLMAYGILYTVASFSTVLPWTTCSNPWNTDHCVDGLATCIAAGRVWDNTSEVCIHAGVDNTTHGGVDNITAPHVVHPSEDYFNNYVLGLSDGLGDMGAVRWQLALCLLLAWIIIVAGLSLGTRSWGKISYVTALLPFVVMLALLIQASLMRGSYEGVLYFITPTWHRLANAQVWVDAAVQVFFSTGCGWGSFITIAKHNKFHDNVLRDAGILVLGDLMTSLLCGFVIFTILGQMAFQLSQPIAQVVTSGPGLAFVVYPQAVSMLPGAPFWAVLFFLMLINLGLGSAMPQVANILVSVHDTFSSHFTSRFHKMALLISLAAITYLLGLPYVTNGGMYLLTLVDTYGPSYTLILTGLCEVLVIAWIYGSDKLQENILEMTGRRPGIFFTVCWKFISPALIVFIFCFMLADWTRLRFGDYLYSWQAELGGLFLTLLQLSPIPIMAVFYILKHRNWGFRQLLQPARDWGPQKC